MVFPKEINLSFRARGLLIVIISSLCCCPIGEQVTGQEPELTWKNNQLIVKLSPQQTKTVAELVAKGEIGRQVFSVRLDAKASANLLGKSIFEPENSRILFRPRFPLDPGTKLVIQIGNKTSLLTKAKFIVPGKKDHRAAQVENIYPSSNKLPANLLKLYVHFSAPMQKGNIYKHFSIFDLEARKEVELPFLELEQELWSRDGLRLTLFFDPGRIKRGLKPREKMGPIFVPGKSYQFRIAGVWKDQTGKPLGADVVKEFAVTGDDFVTPQKSKWKLTHPRIGTKERLTLRFDESMDSALAIRLFRIRRGSKTISFKTIRILEQETLLEFVPDKPWEPGEYTLVFGSELEDLCGNRIGKAFDVELSPKTSKVKPRAQKEFKLLFRLE